MPGRPSRQGILPYQIDVTDNSEGLTSHAGLPLVAAVYEVRDEQKTHYYIGTRPGDPALYAVSLSRLEALIDNDPDVDEVIVSKIDHFKQSAVQKQEPEGGSAQ